MLADKESLKIKPLIKWAGGKTWLAKKILNIVPDNYNNYHEPFIGGASVFLSLTCQQKSFLYDSNGELINFYQQIKKDYLAIFTLLSTYETSEDFYYHIRSQTYVDAVEMAARFYYLNQTCFNGLYRVNQSGNFNVPYGKPTKKFSPDIASFKLMHDMFENSTIECRDFYESLDKIKKNDLVFLDPPYTVAHNLNGFIEYNKKLFSWQDQERLADYILELKKIGAYFILTNANHSSTLNLYKELGNTEIVERYSTIGGKASSRKLISEILVSNCPKSQNNELINPLENSGF